MLDDGRRHRLSAPWLQFTVGLTTCVIELQEDLPTFSMNGIGHEFPTRNLAIVVESGSTQVAIAVGRGNGGFANQEAAFGSTLGIVFSHQLAWNGAWFGAHAGERRKDDAMGDFVWAYLDAGMQFGHDVGSSK
jgi:hypothetical protein